MKYRKMYVDVQYATPCNTLQRTATHCNTLQHIQTCNTWNEYIDLHFMKYRKIYVDVQYATPCNTLQHTATRCNTLQHIQTCNVYIDLHFMKYRKMYVDVTMWKHICVDIQHMRPVYRCISNETRNNMHRQTPELVICQVHCKALQGTARHKKILQHTVMHCNTQKILQHNTLQPITSRARGLCNTLQHTATHCNTLQHTATHCNTLQHTATHCNTLQHTATHCNALQHTATHCNTLQHTATDNLQRAGGLWNS